LNPTPKIKPRTEQATETPIPIVPPSESELELLEDEVADGVPVVAPALTLPVWLGTPLLAVAEVGKVLAVAVTTTS
jgi:hypothetical protein